MTPMGLAQPSNSRGKSQDTSVGGNAGGNMPSDLAELMQLWANMPANAREACLAIARGAIDSKL